jgi:hypothetical protein
MSKESSSRKADQDESDQMKELKDELDSWKRKYFALEAKLSKYNMDQDNVNLYFLSSYSKNHLNKDYYIFKKK